MRFCIREQELASIPHFLLFFCGASHSVRFLLIGLHSPFFVVFLRCVSFCEISPNLDPITMVRHHHLSSFRPLLVPRHALTLVPFLSSQNGREKVNEFLSDKSPEADLNVGPHMGKLRYCIGYLKTLVLEGGRGGGGGKGGGGGDPDVEDKIKKLQGQVRTNPRPQILKSSNLQQVKQRDDEIVILVNPKPQTPNPKP